MKAQIISECPQSFASRKSIPIIPAYQGRETDRCASSFEACAVHLLPEYVTFYGALRADNVVADEPEDEFE